jgi:hypothetical protein
MYYMFFAHQVEYGKSLLTIYAQAAEGNNVESSLRQLVILRMPRFGLKTCLSHASAADSPDSIAPPGTHHNPLSARRVSKTFVRVSSKMTAEHPKRNFPSLPSRGP